MTYKLTITPENPNQLEHLMTLVNKHHGWILRYSFPDKEEGLTSARIQFEDEHNLVQFEEAWYNYLTGINGES